MKKSSFVILGLLAFVAPQHTVGQAQQQSQSQQSSSSPQQRPPDYRERYGVLVERNIFLRNRSRPPARTPTTNSSESGTRPSRRPEQSYLLTGIVMEEGRRIAFIENTSTSSTERLAVGASIAGGKIIDVDFHHLEFESASGQRSKVEIGKTLAGGERSSSGSTEVAGTQPSDSSAPIDPNKPNMTPEERLRLRRQQEIRR